MLVYLEDPTDIDSIQRFRPKNNAKAREFVSSISNGYVVEVFRKQSPWSICLYKNGIPVHKMKYSLLSHGGILIDKYIRNLDGHSCYIVDAYTMSGLYSSTFIHGVAHWQVSVQFGDKMKYFKGSVDITRDIYCDESLGSWNDYTGYVDVDKLPMDTLFNLTLEYPVNFQVDPVLSSTHLYELGLEIHRKYLAKFGSDF